MNRITKRIYQGFIPLPPDLSGWHGDDPIFDELIDQTRPDTIIEVGSWKGASAINMVWLLRKYGIKAKIYCVDTWLGSLEFWTELRESPERDLCLRHGYPQVYYQFLSNVIHNDAQDYIVPVPNTSAIAAGLLLEHGITANLVYIDASHEENDVFDDMCRYWDLLRDGGVMFGDDGNWGSRTGSVLNALRRFSRMHAAKYFLDSNKCFWRFVKAK